VSDEPVYEFVKGQGWVPRAKPKYTSKPDIFVEIALQPWPNERYGRPRRVPTLAEFERLVRTVPYGNEYDDTMLEYRLRDGHYLRWLIPRTNHHDIDWEHAYARGLRQLYAEAERQGF
jgi:hypothetical protein